MKHFALFGHPVVHSLSPRMHNNAFINLGINARYGRVDLSDGKELRKVFLHLGLSGANVTVPHKEMAYLLVDEVIGVARDIGAINTIIKQNHKLIGFNTDCTGFMRSIEEFREIKKVLILGAGGTAKALSFILREKNIKVCVLNRSQNRLEEFEINRFITFTHESLNEFDFDLVVNSTSAGLKDELLPAPKEILEKVFVNARYAYEVIYSKSTPFLNLANKFNLTCKDGKEMLLWQGVYAFNLFNENKLIEEQIKLYMQEGLEL